MPRSKGDDLELALLTVPPQDENTSLFPGNNDLTWQNITLTHAQNAYRKHDYKIVKDHCESVLTKERNNLEARFLLGRVAIQEKEYVKAAGYFDAIQNHKNYIHNPIFNNDREILFKALIAQAQEALKKAESLPYTSICECDVILTHLDQSLLAANTAIKFGKAAELIAKAVAIKLTILKHRGCLTEQSLFDALKNEVAAAAGLPYITLTQCNQGVEVIKSLSEKLKQLKFTDKAALTEQLNELSQKLHQVSANIKYQIVIGKAPSILKIHPSSLSEAELTERHMQITELIELINQFFRHEKEMGEALQQFDPKFEKITSMRGYYIKLHNADEDAETELTYKMCVRGSNLIPSINTMTLATSPEWLSALERIIKSLEPQASVHADSRTLLEKVKSKAQKLREKILAERAMELATRSFENTTRRLEVGDSEKNRIKNVVTQALQDTNREDIHKAIVYAQPADLQEHQIAVQTTLMHYYSHKRYLLCCYSNELSLPSNFEEDAKTEIQENFSHKL